MYNDITARSANIQAGNVSCLVLVFGLSCFNVLEFKNNLMCTIYHHCVQRRSFFTVESYSCSMIYLQLADTD
jgi:hypothetical protein